MHLVSAINSHYSVRPGNVKEWLVVLLARGPKNRGTALRYVRRPALKGVSSR